ncbi:unnamed protein product [Absidia cylindrospora]
MSSSTTISKEFHYASLHAQLEELNNNVMRLNKNIQATNEHVPALQKIGTLHTAMTMSATRVLNETNHLERLHRQHQQ